MKNQQFVKTLFCTLSMLGCVGSGWAQGAAPAIISPRMPVVVATPVDGGTVTGHVYCTDTQRPARFASVELLQTMDMGTQGGSSRGPVYQTVARGRTALDGSFSIVGVVPGDYFVVATMTGYISPLSASRMTQSALTGAAATHVEANHSSDVNVSIDRGAVVSGRVTYDDGSPVPGVMVRLRPVAGGTSGSARFGSFSGAFVSFDGGMGMASTDDRGTFRLSGIAPGSYMLTAMVETETTGRGSVNRTPYHGPTLVNVYAPATMRKADARVVEVHGGETIDGIDIQVALNGLRTVTGSVESKADGHMLSGGTASLADSTDSGVMRSAAIDSDGTFRMEYLPPGTYTLTVQGEDRSQDGSGRTARGTTTHYQRGTQSVTVGDHDMTIDAVQLDETKS